MWPVDSPAKKPVMREACPCHDVIVWISENVSLKYSLTIIIYNNMDAIEHIAVVLITFDIKLVPDHVIKSL